MSRIRSCDSTIDMVEYINTQSAPTQSSVQPINQNLNPPSFDSIPPKTTLNQSPKLLYPLKITRMSDPPISRYGGYVHSNPNYEDFKMWNSACEDAEPDWEYRNAQREEREQREKAQRAAERMEQERKEQEQKEKRQREEQERKEWKARRALARKEAARREQKEREQKEKEEEEQKAIRALVIKRMQEELKKMKKEEEALKEEEAEVYWKLRRSQEELERTINITKLGLERAKQDLQESQRETDSYQRRSEAVHSGSQPH
jgi:hypothetical protein